MKRLLILALMAGPLLAADWTEFRGPGGRGRRYPGTRALANQRLRQRQHPRGRFPR